MKLLLFIICITSLLSCQKSTDVLLPELTSNAKKYFFVSDVTETYQSRMFNTCLNEWVSLTGTVNYHIKESHENGYYLDYLITLKADGVGESSGIQFRGGGKSDGRVRQNEDGTDVKGKVSYSIKYSSAEGNHMGYYQQAKFILKDNVIKVEFNNETPTCE